MDLLLDFVQKSFSLWLSLSSVTGFIIQQRCLQYRACSDPVLLGTQTNSLGYRFVLFISPVLTISLIPIHRLIVKIEISIPFTLFLHAYRSHRAV